MEERKNNAMEKVENAVEYAESESFPKEKSSNDEVMVLRERRKMERERAKTLRFKQKVRLKEQKMMEKRQERLHRRRLEEQSLKAKRDEKRRKEEDRRIERERSRGKGGYIVAIISLGIATLILSSVLTFTYLTPSKSDNALESSYQRAFYDTVEQVNNMDLNLSKTLVTKDDGARQGYLLNLAINSELAENNINELPIRDENKHYTTKLINQIGDYAKYLCKKLANGETLSTFDKETLAKLKNANDNLKETLYKTLSNMDEDFSFSAMDSNKDNLLLTNLADLQNLSTEYPELIYDGPFSDGLSNREVKGLKGAKITENEALDTFNRIFAQYSVKESASFGETQGLIECYNVSGMVNDDDLYAQFSKVGGKLIMFEYKGSCREVNFLEDSAVESAKEFLASLEIENMKPVWINLANNVYTINCAFTQDDVIVYSDLIKVRVCAETKMVIGFEASTYYMNHEERTIPSPSATMDEAKRSVVEDLELSDGRLCLIPVGSKSEKLCYEFEGVKDNQTYYVYIDANTLRQAELFKVISSSDGDLLM